jgi:16S rRNA (cytidine1402-2'-O)-methyltransferase
VRGGTLFVVATPLGNLGDLTARATETLRRVPVVAAEDTRHSRKLLSHLDAHPRLLSFHAHSGLGAGAAVLAALERGEDVALVTDAGTPAVSDPGASLVALARDAGYGVVPIPGPSAVATALSAAGLSGDRYLFLGFLPRRGPDRARMLARVASEEWTTVLFEAPGRVGTLLADLARECGGNRTAVVARELTKLHEEFVTGSLEQLAGRFAAEAEEVRGECTLVIAGAPAAAIVDPAERGRPAAVRLVAAGVSRKEVASLLTELFEIPRNDAYRLAMEAPAP